MIDSLAWDNLRIFLHLAEGNTTRNGTVSRRVDH